MKFLILILMISLYPINIYSQTNSDFIITYKNNYNFAKYLYNEKDYIRAAGEFEKCLFYSNNLMTEKSDSILYWIGKSYREGEKYRISNIFLKKINPSDTNTYWDVKLLLSANYFNLGKYDSSLVFLNSNQNENANSNIPYRYQQLKIANYIIQKQYDQAKRYLSNESESNTEILKILLDKGENSKKKFPILAGALSAIVPGSGKVYTKRPLDGLYSFLIVGVTSWRAYEGYKSKGIESIDFWVFGSMASYFYLGNIYGSAISAKIYNEKIDNEIKNSIEVFVNVNF